MSIVRHVIIRGRVQGVGYRAWAERTALRSELEGWVRNRRDGTVEAAFSGSEEAVLAIIEECRHGPRGAAVTGIDVDPGDAGLLRLRRPGERFSMLATV